MKLWIDDMRSQPDASWIRAYTSRGAIAALERFSNPAWYLLPHEEIALDHDLGGDDTTRPVVLWMIEHGFKFDKYTILTANPVGREWLEGMIERYLR